MYKYVQEIAKLKSENSNFIKEPLWKQFAVELKSSQITCKNKCTVNIRKYCHNSTAMIDKLCKQEKEKLELREPSILCS